MQHYRFLNHAGYLKALAAKIDGSMDNARIIVATMDFDPSDSLVAKLLAAMRAAAERGADVTLLVDAHAFLSDERGIPGPLFYRFNLADFRGAFAEKLHALQAIETSGGRFCLTNFPTRRFNPPPVGRSHIKGAVVDDTVYLGGCNLEHPEQIDTMVQWENAKAANVLAEWLSRIAEHPDTRKALGEVDVETRLDSKNTLLLDAGVPKQSLIYDEALQIIDEAKEWLFMTCQYFPGGTTARHLAAAQARGVKIDLRYSHPKSHGRDAPLQYLHQLAMKSSGLPSNLLSSRLSKDAPKLHSKILASERAGLVGSHNYVEQGVRFGTAEIALKSTDREFAKTLLAFTRRQIKQLA